MLQYLLKTEDLGSIGLGLLFTAGFYFVSLAFWGLNKKYLHYPNLLILTVSFTGVLFPLCYFAIPKLNMFLSLYLNTYLYVGNLISMMTFGLTYALFLTLATKILQTLKKQDEEKAYA